MRSVDHPINVRETYYGRSTKFLHKPTCCGVKFETIPVYVMCTYVRVRNSLKKKYDFLVT